MMDHPVRKGDGVELHPAEGDVSEDKLFRGPRHPLGLALALPAVQQLELRNRLVFRIELKEGMEML